MEPATVARDCEGLHAESMVPQWKSEIARLDDDQGNSSSYVGFVEASTSGRVELADWRRRRRRRRVWASPTGVLYVVNPCNFVYNELEQGRKLEENVLIDGTHSISTCFEQGRFGEEKSILMTTSHKMGANLMLSTHYVNNFCGGYEYTCNTSHAMFPASRLSSCLYMASIGDPTLEVELEQEQETKKMSETILANLRTGERFLKLQSKSNINDNVALSSTYRTDLRGNHSVKLEAALPLWRFANVSKSFTTDFQESREFCLNARRRISEGDILKLEFVRNCNQVSVELQRVAQGVRDVAVKFISNLQGSTQFKVTSTHTRQPNSVGWTLRKVSNELYSVGVEWKRESSPDKFLLVRLSSQNQRCTVYAEGTFYSKLVLF